MKSSHKYAIKRDGKTLGIKDAEHLHRLVMMKAVGLESEAFVIAEKRWLRISDIIGVVDSNVSAELQIPFADVEFADEQTQSKQTSPHRPTREFANLMEDLNDEFSKMAADNNNQSSQSINLEAAKTIFKPAREEGSSVRRRRTQVAAKIPNPEGPISRKYSAVFALVVMLLGMAVGLYGSIWISGQNGSSDNQQVLQAKTESTIQGKSKN